ncbi:ATP-binding protein [Streptomyces sp. NPDC056160]|uniref:ATP-binding protein n=1 Tax=Streptomyces sp. NPDC056160 TaxID=3345731 RepID=UPI0035D6B280
MNADTAHSTAPTSHLAIRLSATPRGARLARRLTAHQLDDWGWPYDTEADRTAALLVAELAANAVQHGGVRGRDFRLRLTLHTAGPAPALRIEVTDSRPERRPPGPGMLPPPSIDAESGRGLLLVEALAAHWGTVCADPYTKTVWCETVLA